LLSINFFLFISFDDFDLLPENKLSIVIIDVGQGDAALIKFPNGKTALVDAGDVNYFFDNGEKIVLPLLDHFNIKTVDFAFVSHLDSDHYGGFVSLINKGKIDKIIKPALDTSFKKDIKFENYLYEKKIATDYYQTGSMEVGNVKLYFLNDCSELTGKKISTNDKSGIIKLVYGNFSILFTGDMEIKAENFITSKYREYLKSDVLKVAHHGSKTSSSIDFLNYVQPSLSVISAGIQNKFNHPSPGTIEKLNYIDSEILRTDISGAVIVQSDGESFEVIDWKKYY
jgi:competence protein ComEC